MSASNTSSDNAATPLGSRDCSLCIVLILSKKVPYLHLFAPLLYSLSVILPSPWDSYIVTLYFKFVCQKRHSKYVEMDVQSTCKAEVNSSLAKCSVL